MGSWHHVERCHRCVASQQWPWLSSETELLYCNTSVPTISQFTLIKCRRNAGDGVNPNPSIYCAFTMFEYDTGQIVSFRNLIATVATATEACGVYFQKVISGGKKKSLCISHVRITTGTLERAITHHCWDERREKKKMKQPPWNQSHKRLPVIQFSNSHRGENNHKHAGTVTWVRRHHQRLVLIY